MPVWIHNNQRCFRVNNSLIKKVLKHILIDEGHTGVDVSVTLVDNQRIKRLNQRYLKRDKITDVIAFTLKGTEDASNDRLLGEIVVSVEKGLQEARRRKIAPQREILLYCIHGLLHLLGYNDLKPRERAIMEARQQTILASL